MLNDPNLHALHTRNTRTCISLLIPNPHSKKRTFLQASQKQLYPPSPATHSIPKTPPHLWRNGCHVSREIMGASEHSTRERDNLAQGLARDPVRHPGSPKKAFAALAPGSWSWVASGTAQFWNLMQERSHGALTFDFFFLSKNKSAKQVKTTVRSKSKQQSWLIERSAYICFTAKQGFA